MSLEGHIKRLIDLCGPMDIGTYMQTCLGHPEHGYYVSRSAIGAEGDFITAPEISQMFGELIGIWCADLWIRSGKGEINLLECGPGRGTLMADMLRATRGIEGFHSSIKLHFLETSPRLREQQARALGDLEGDLSSPIWHDDLSTVPEDKSLFSIANEFLDALPIRQLVKSADGWLEKCVHVNQKNELTYITKPAEAELITLLPQQSRNANQGDVYEISPSRYGWLNSFADKLKKTSGAGLFIDYGFDGPARGDTLQAVQDHKYADPLAMPGKADLTAHVDFSQIREVAKETDTTFYGVQKQGVFLKHLGIEQRAEILKSQVDNDTAGRIAEDLYRLVSENEMGELFKVVCLTSPDFSVPEGFEDDA